MLRTSLHRMVHKTFLKKKIIFELLCIVEGMGHGNFKKMFLSHNRVVITCDARAHDADHSRMI